MIYKDEVMRVDVSLIDEKHDIISSAIFEVRVELKARPMKQEIYFQDRVKVAESCDVDIKTDTTALDKFSFEKFLDAALERWSDREIEKQRD